MQIMPHWIIIVFLFALGACIGSFLNVVVWRLPRGQSLVTPPSHCPKCSHKLAWYDNLPVIGWILLRGRCRYCGVYISARYPIVEAVTGGLFVLYYVVFFMLQMGPCPPGAEMRLRPLMIEHDWPMYGLYMLMIACLLAASLIDAELYIIPLEIPWLMAGVGILVHAVIDRPTVPGALNVGAVGAALGLGAGLGLLISLALLKLNVFKMSFAEGEPMLEVDRAMLLKDVEKAKAEGRELSEEEMKLPPVMSRQQIRHEINKEMIFLTPPLALGAIVVALTAFVQPIAAAWSGLMQYHWFTGLLGAVLGALVGGFVVWMTRILGTMGFGRVAMGLGDVHLMFGVGAIIGAGAATVAFFLAPFFTIIIALYMLITRTKRELPFGPYLSMSSAFLLVFYCDVANYLRPGVEGFFVIMRRLMGLPLI
jgi:leader peptidase (prepilin peptidase) / N-methyltransferase